MTSDAIDFLLPPSGGARSARPAAITYGKVTSLSPLAVQFNGTAPGAAVSGVLAVDDFSPQVNDIVILIQVGPSWVILGSIAGGAPTGGGLPIGSVVPYAGSAAPVNHFICNGQAISRTTYAVLFGLIGTTYGAGDGSTTFALPDLRSRTPVGVGDGGASLSNRTLGQKFGAETHTLTETEIPSHDHSAGSYATTTGGNHRHAPEGGSSFAKNVYPYTTSWTFVGGSGNLEANGGTFTAYAGNHAHSVTGGSGYAGGGGAHNNVQPSLGLSFIIRAL